MTEVRKGRTQTLADHFVGVPFEREAQRMADKLVDNAKEVEQRRTNVLEKYAKVKLITQQRRARLEDARKFQQFKRDAEELEAWITEKMLIAADESYKDPTNLPGKIQKHHTFEAEVSAHNKTLKTLRGAGEGMTGDRHFAADKITVSPSAAC